MLYLVAFSLLAFIGLGMALRRSSSRHERTVGVAVLGIGVGAILGTQAIDVAREMSTPDMTVNVKVPR